MVVTNSLTQNCKPHWNRLPQYKFSRRSSMCIESAKFSTASVETFPRVFLLAFSISPYLEKRPNSLFCWLVVCYTYIWSSQDHIFVYVTLYATITICTINIVYLKSKSKTTWVVKNSFKSNDLHVDMLTLHFYPIVHIVFYPNVHMYDKWTHVLIWLTWNIDNIFTEARMPKSARYMCMVSR